MPIPEAASLPRQTMAAERELRLVRARYRAQSAVLKAHPDVNTQLRDACEGRRYASAMRAILAEYGPEIRKFFAGRARDEAMFEEAFSMFSEDVWKGLPEFRFECSVRSWLFVIARHALARCIRSRLRWTRRHVALEPAELADADSQQRDAEGTLRAQLRPFVADLSAGDQRLLEQRLALAMEWKDIALHHMPVGTQHDQDALERESARWRKRYQLLIGRLRRQAAGAAVH